MYMRYLVQCFSLCLSLCNELKVFICFKFLFLLVKIYGVYMCNVLYVPKLSSWVYSCKVLNCLPMQCSHLCTHTKFSPVYICTHAKFLTCVSMQSSHLCTHAKLLPGYPCKVLTHDDVHVQSSHLCTHVEFYPLYPCKVLTCVPVTTVNYPFFRGTNCLTRVT